MARSTARKRALNTLYEADEKNQDIASLLEERIAYSGAQTPLPEYAIEICRGVADHRKAVDRMLNRYSTKWKVGRMSVIDRNILRIGAWEILFNDEVPDGVAIDEAIALAKTMSDAGSPSFIHGLLSAVSAHKDDIDSEGRLVSDASDGAEESGDAADGEQAQPVEAALASSEHVPSENVSTEAMPTAASDAQPDSHGDDDWSDWDADLSEPADQTGPQEQPASADSSDESQG